MNYYVPKNSIVSAQKVEKDGTVLTQVGEFLVLENQVTLTDRYGNVDIISEEWLKENYIPLKKERKVTKPKYDLDEMAKAYLEMGEIVKQSNENDENYIFEPSKVV
jgi:hypothetical protein